MDQEWITIDEAADRLGLAASSVKRLFDQGKIAVRPVPGGGRGWAGRLLSATDIAAIIAERQAAKQSSDELTIRQVADRLGVSYERTRNLIKAAGLAGRVVYAPQVWGGTRVYKTADIEALQERRKQCGTSN